VLLGLDDPGSEAVAEEVAAAVVTAVERLGVDAVDALHAERQAPELGLDDEVVVVRHQAEHVHAPVVAANLRGEQGEEEPPLVVVQKDRAARDASRGHVVNASLRQFPTRSPHVADASAPECGRQVRSVHPWTKRHTLVTLALSLSAHCQGQSLAVAARRRRFG
jgi:hypothetical protein